MFPKVPICAYDLALGLKRVDHYYGVQARLLKRHFLDEVSEKGQFV